MRQERFLLIIVLVLIAAGVVASVVARSHDAGSAGRTVENKSGSTDFNPPPNDPATYRLSSSSDDASASEEGAPAQSTSTSASREATPIDAAATHAVPKSTFCEWLDAAADVADESFSSITFGDGTLTCTYDGGALPPNHPLNVERATGVFETLYAHFPYAQRYVLYIPRGKYVEESLKMTMTQTALAGAVTGRGESGHLHYDDEAVARSITILEDGLPTHAS